MLASQSLDTRLDIPFRGMGHHQGYPQAGSGGLGSFGQEKRVSGETRLRICTDENEVLHPYQRITFCSVKGSNWCENICVCDCNWNSFVHLWIETGLDKKEVNLARSTTRWRYLCIAVIRVTSTAVLPVMKHRGVLPNFLEVIRPSIFDREWENSGRKHGE